MNAPLYSIVYCSRNLITGEPAEVAKELQQILDAARRNNSKAGVTGALLYSAGSFAQVLEGPLAGIEPIFEKIQRDARHGEVTVIESGTVRQRQFPEWSMAFAGSSYVDGDPKAIAAFDAAFSGTEGGGDQILSLLKNLVVNEEDCVLS